MVSFCRLCKILRWHGVASPQGTLTSGCLLGDRVNFFQWGRETGEEFVTRLLGGLKEFSCFFWDFISGIGKGKLHMEAEKKLEMFIYQTSMVACHVQHYREPWASSVKTKPTLDTTNRHVEVSWSIWWVFHVGIPCPGTIVTLNRETYERSRLTTWKKSSLAADGQLSV